ncbi:MAG: hypothetical protein ACR2N8_00480 [Parvibaculales bacterium]
MEFILITVGLILFFLILRGLMVQKTIAKVIENFNHPDELRKIQKAIRKNSNTKTLVSNALKELSKELSKLDKNSDSYKDAIKDLMNREQERRHKALRDGASSDSHPEWAAAAACESWVQTLWLGDKAEIEKVEAIIQELIEQT